MKNKKNWRRLKLYIFLLMGSILFFVGCMVRTVEPEEFTTEQQRNFEKRTIYIPMRDGVGLNTEIFSPRRKVPKNKNVPLPILFYRTPYGIYNDHTGDNYLLNYVFNQLAEDGYIFVFQDIRGRFESEGQFVMDRLLRDKNDPNAIDESTDAYDSIQWMLTNIPGNNGRVGMLGDSYSGWLTVMAMIDPHPALTAVAILGNNADYYIGDDFFHYGAFRLNMCFEFAYMMETSNVNESFPFGEVDLYQWFLDLGPLSNVNQDYFHGQLPTWNDFMEHPNYDSFWKAHAVVNHIKGITVPTLIVAAWWDSVDFYGPMKTYETLEQYDSNNLNYLVVGPWEHNGWWYRQGDNLGPFYLGDSTAVHFRANIQAPWFAYFLKDEGSLDWPEALTFRTGSNQWVSHAQWPPKENISIRNLYFHEESKLSFNWPQSNRNETFVSYLSDPSDPVPYTQRPIEPFLGGLFLTWKYEDQRFVQDRPDVMSWETDVLEEDVIAAGRISAEFYASTSGTDCDWVVKLIDVFPEEYPENPNLAGYRLMIADEVMRAKFRNSLEIPEPVTPGEVTYYRIDLNSRHHCFRAGHKIMVQMQSTWFPLIGRNPQRFVDIPTATEQDYQNATQRIYFSKQYPSHIKIPILEQ